MNKEEIIHRPEQKSDIDKCAFCDKEIEAGQTAIKRYYHPYCDPRFGPLNPASQKSEPEQCNHEWGIGKDRKGNQWEACIKCNAPKPDTEVDEDCMEISKQALANQDNEWEVDKIVFRIVARIIGTAMQPDVIEGKYADDFERYRKDIQSLLTKTREEAQRDMLEVLEGYENPTLMKRLAQAKQDTLSLVKEILGKKLDAWSIEKGGFGELKHQLLTELGKL